MTTGINSNSKLSKFEDDLKEVLIKHGVDVYTNTDAQIVAKYAVTCIGAMKTLKQEDKASPFDAFRG